MIDQIKIKTLLKSDIPNIRHLQPEGWKDIRKVFFQFIDFDFFYPVKAIFEDRIISLGEVILNRDSAWIGNIIVDRSFRNKGIGTFITDYLSKYIDSNKKSSQLVLATPIGIPIYEKLGFKYLSDYLFFKKEAKDPQPLHRSTSSPLKLKGEYIFDYEPRYFNQVLELDEKAMGENRAEVLKEFTRDAILFVKDDLEGFYLPHLGDGLIIAKNHEAGFNLLEIKWATKSESIILPEENLEIIEFAKSKGFKLYRHAARMILGDIFNWNPQMIYNRVGGYLG